MRYVLMAIFLKPFIIFSYLVFVAYVVFLCGKLPEGKIKRFLLKEY